MVAVAGYTPKFFVDISLFNSPYYFVYRKGQGGVPDQREIDSIVIVPGVGVPQEEVLGFCGMTEEGVYNFMELYQQAEKGEEGAITLNELDGDEMNSLRYHNYPYIGNNRASIVSYNTDTSRRLSGWNTDWGQVTLNSMWPGRFFSYAGFISGRLMFGFGSRYPGRFVFSSPINTPVINADKLIDNNPLNILVGGRGPVNSIVFTPFFEEINLIMSRTFEDYVVSTSPNRGFTSILSFEEGVVNIQWVTSIAFALWIGTDVGSFAMTTINANTFEADLIVDPERNTDQGSQENSPPVVLERVLLQISDSRKFVYIIQDSEELRRKVTDTVTRRIELDAFSEGDIQSIHSSARLGFVGILTEDGKVYFGVMKTDDVAFTEWEFTSPVKDMSMLGRYAYFYLQDNKIYRVDLTGREPIEENVNLSFETHSPKCYFLNYVFSESDQDPMNDLDDGRISLKDCGLYGTFICEEVGIGTREGGVIDVVGSDDLGLTHDTDGNVTAIAEGFQNGSTISFQDAETVDSTSGVVFYFEGRKRLVDLSYMFVHIPR